MTNRQFGSDQGRLVVYFHGAPGAPGEAALFDRLGKAHGLRFLSFDRFAFDRSLTGEAYFRALAEAISGEAGGASVDLIGFSIGAFVALQTCRHLGAGVRSLHLVSAAAPLEAGDFLGTMAGGGVFRVARTAPALFECLSWGQGLLARAFPAALFSLLFASAAGEDRVLAADPAFQVRMKETLRDCFVERMPGYIRDIEAYVQPWGAMLSGVEAETHVWHGRQDSWSPVGMADYLASEIPGCSQVEIMEGLSHYSCLHHAAERICRRLARPEG
ncbi:alpha/beta fold hydrolase [Methylococcus mesophilus]|uniref:alpha/beta fold hydrolase n=1 Tax=Methylococcus mesophilus TaxID=2993564 RepID=UPI00224B536B|nr:alpha/beta hydrolase [Methylococcus mesophilus]UZR27786.1 alpha/beta hydrolase [Methylococcus mesophilus]